MIMPLCAVRWRAVAEFFGKKVLRDVDEETFLKAIPEVRKVTGDRAVVRAIHFYNDSRRAGEIYEAIKADVLTASCS